MKIKIVATFCFDYDMESVDDAMSKAKQNIRELDIRDADSINLVYERDSDDVEGSYMRINAEERRKQGHKYFRCMNCIYCKRDEFNTMSMCTRNNKNILDIPDDECQGYERNEEELKANWKGWL